MKFVCDELISGSVFASATGSKAIVIRFAAPSIVSANFPAIEDPRRDGKKPSFVQGGSDVATDQSCELGLILVAEQFEWKA